MNRVIRHELRWDGNTRILKNIGMQGVEEAYKYIKDNGIDPEKTKAVVVVVSEAVVPLTKR